MAMTYNSHGVEILLSLFLTMGSLVAASGGSLYQDIDLSWGGSRSKIVDGGKLLTLALDKDSGSGFQSKRAYFFGRIDMDIKLVGGNSAGTVTAFYLCSEWPNQDEIDFEFLGNLSGDPYTVYTNVYTQGKGDREQQFHLWFDPTKDFHKYSIVWNPQRIIFLVDNIPIRVYNNDEKIGVSFPKTKPMKLHSSLWNADQWATRGGRIKTNWSQAPFTAYYRNFNDNSACVWSLGSSTTSCGSGKTSDSMANQGWKTQGLDANGRKILRWVQKYYMIYNYCTDYRRFPHGRPTECRRGSRFL